MNLTSVEDGAELAQFHYAESLALARALPDAALSIVDIGSGAGFPGIPVAIVRPDCRVTLVESNKRKAVFLREAARGLANVEVLAERAEKISGPYDYAVSRAVRPQFVMKLSLAEDFAFLLSETEFKTLPAPRHVLKLAGTKNRIIAMFHVEHDRIDETSG